MACLPGRAHGRNDRAAACHRCWAAVIEVRRLGEDLAGPVVACDQCGGLVEHLGNVLWQYDPGRDRMTAGPAVVHKGACTRAFEAAHPGRWAWEELGVWLWQLTGNARIDPALAARLGQAKQRW
jgi:hypothetical protein